MEIKTTITIIPENDKERILDKEYWLKCYRAKNSIQALNKISMDIVMGRLYPNNNTAAIIQGIAWKK